MKNVWEFLGGDNVGQMMLRLHRISVIASQKVVSKLHYFHCAMLCFERFAHQPASIVARIHKAQIAGLHPEYVQAFVNHSLEISLRLYRSEGFDQMARITSAIVFDIPRR